MKFKAVPEVLEIIMLDNPVASPSKVRFVKVPHPTGIISPITENPITAPTPADTVKPAASASPPNGDEGIAPTTEN